METRGAGFRPRIYKRRRTELTTSWPSNQTSPLVFKTNEIFLEHLQSKAINKILSLGKTRQKSYKFVVYQGFSPLVGKGKRRDHGLEQCWDVPKTDNKLKDLQKYEYNCKRCYIRSPFKSHFKTTSPRHSEKHSCLRFSQKNINLKYS